MVSIVLLLIGLVHVIYKINFKSNRAIDFEGNIKLAKDIFEFIEHHFNTIRIVLNVFLLVVSIYIFIFVDSLHKSIQEFRNRLYAVAKLWEVYEIKRSLCKLITTLAMKCSSHSWGWKLIEKFSLKTIKSILGFRFENICSSLPIKWLTAWFQDETVKITYFCSLWSLKERET